ncbi:MAG: L-fucose:H+ symporter permease [Chloroherpetonaceae bacterium]|nr:L-fucose:H+ symporter permease [Chloroherpetonaceae bacterium]
MNSPIGTQPQTLSQESNKNYTPAFITVTTLFFMWGFLTCLNDILIPHLKSVFELSFVQAAMVQFTFFSAYFIMSLPAGKVIAKVGYKSGIVIGLSTAGVGALLFYPAAAFLYYPFFLLALFVLATGITLLQVAANPYVSVLGKPETASSRLNLAQAFNSLGTTIAPAVGGLLILSGTIKTAEELQAMTPEAMSMYKLSQATLVQLPYIGLAIALFILAGAMAFFNLPTISTVEGNEKEESSFGEVLREKQLAFGALGIFLYVGGEVSIGSYLVNFIGLEEIAGLPENQAAAYVSYYWGGAMIGRFIGSYLLTVIKPGRLLGAFAITAALLVFGTLMTKGSMAMFLILSVGLMNSIMFPTIFTLGIDGLGQKTNAGSSIMIMAIVGGAILPVLMGAMADSIGLHQAFWLPLLCYVYIAYYGFIGSQHR